MADVQATAGLSATGVRQGFDQILDNALRFRRAFERVLAFDPLDNLRSQLGSLSTSLQAGAVSPQGPFQGVQRGAQVAVTSTNEARAAVEQYRNASLALRGEVEAGIVTEERAAQEARELKTEILAVAEGTDRWSREQRELLTAAARTERTIATLEGRQTRLGISQQVAIGGTRALTNAFQGLQGALLTLTAGAGLGALIRFTQRAAQSSAEARLALDLFFDELEARGGTEASGVVLLERLSRQFRTTREDVAGAIGPLLRLGATLEQAETILQRAGASALAYGRNASVGFEAATQALQGETSQVLNRIGIAGNISTAFREQAQALGIATDQLNEQQKVQAFVNLLLSETEQEYAALDRSLSGFIGAQADAQTALTNFNRSIGAGLGTVLGPLLRVFSSILNAFLALPTPVQRIIGILTGFAIVLGTAAAAVGVLTSNLVRQQILGNLILALLRSEFVLRSRLGGALVALAGRYGLLGEAQLAAAGAARTSAVQVQGTTTVLAGLRTAIRTTITSVGRLTVAFARFALTPVGASIVAIVAALALIERAVRRNQAVFEPAFNAFSRALQGVGQTLSPLIEIFNRLFQEGGFLANLWRDVLVSVAFVLAQALIQLAAQLRVAAASVTFLINVFRRGPGAASREFRSTLEEIRTETQAVSRDVTVMATAALHASGEIDNLGDSANNTSDEIAQLRKEAEELFEQFSQDLEARRISLIEDDEQRKIAQAVAEFEKLRQAIRDAAAENEVFAAQAPSLLADAFALEAEAISQIQAEAREQRLREEREALEELQGVIEDREKAIARARIEGLEGELEILFANYELQRAETVRLYEDLIEQADGFSAEQQRLVALRNEELLVIDQNYVKEVRDTYAALYEDLDARQQEFLRSQIELRDDPRLLAAFDFGAQLAQINQFFDERLNEAAGQAEAVRRIEEQRNAELVAAREQYWETILRITRERGETIAELEQELNLRRLEFARGDERDEAAIVRARFAAELSETLRGFEELERAFEGNAVELARIDRLKADTITQINQELARSLADIAETDQAEAFSPVVDSLLSNLEDANFQTIDSIRDQINSWRVAYGSNGEIVMLLDKALDSVEARYQSLTETVSKEIDELISSSGKLADDILLRENARELDEVGRVYQEAGQRVEEAQAEIQRIAQALVNATGEQRDELLRNAEALQQGIALILASADLEAERITEEAERAAQEEFNKLESTVREATQKAIDASREALAEFDRSVVEIRADVSEDIISSVSSRVEDAIGRVNTLNLTALQAARTELTRILAQLTIAGVSPEALAEIEAQRTEIDQVIASFSARRADFAAQQLSQLRSVAAAVLDEDEARRVSLTTLEAEVAFRREAVTALDEFGGTAEETASRIGNLVSSQLALISGLESEVSVLRDAQDGIRQSFADVRTLAGITGQAIPESVLAAQRQIVLQQAEQVRALQATGAPFREYREQLQATTRDWEAFTAAAEGSVQAQVADVINAAVRQATANNKERVEQAQETIRVTQEEIKVLEERQRVLEGTNTVLSESQEFLRILEEIEGVELTEEQQLTRLEEQRSLLIQLLDNAVAANLPLSERLGLLRQIRDVNTEIVEQGGEGIDISAAALRNARSEVAVARDAALSSAEEIAANQARLEELNAALEETQRIAKELETVDATAFADPIRLDALARAASTIFGISFQEASERLATALREGTTTPFEDLSVEVPSVFRQIFQALGLEARQAPEVFFDLEAEITQLEEDLERLRGTVAAGLDLEAVQQGAASGFRGVLAALETEGVDGFEGIGREGARAFTVAFNTQVEESRAETLATVAGIEDELRTTLEQAFEEPAEEAGFDAGRGLAQAFARGLEENQNQLLSIVEALLQRIRDMLPSSDARRGPLSDITRSGSTFFPTWLRGVRRSQPALERAMASATSGLLPSLSGARRLPVGAIGTAGASPVTMNIDGRPTAPAGSTVMQARSLVRAVSRELRVRRLR